MTTTQHTLPSARNARPQAEAVIDLDAVAENVRRLREFAGDAAVMAVVKADAYNHGAVPVAKAALAAGARELGVTTLGEAIELRAAGIEAPVLSWLHASDADFAPAIVANVELGVSSPRHLESIVAAAHSTGTTASIAVKVDTGLNRNGVAPDEWDVSSTILRAPRPRGRCGCVVCSPTSRTGTNPSTASTTSSATV